MGKMSDLPPEQARKLGLVLALLSSNHDGEVVNAARLSVKILAASGLRPEDMAATQPAARSGARPEPSPTPEDDNEQPNVGRASSFAEYLSKRAVGLTEREQSFLNDLIMKGWGRPTEKQRAWLDAIAKKVPQKRRGAA